MSRIVTLSLTEAGAALGDKLPFPHVKRAKLAAEARERWDDVEGLVLVGATGIAVRAIGPLLADKHEDPAVVALDDAGRWAIALTGGHRGANDLAREVAALVGAEPVVTTATDEAGLPGLDTLPGFRASGDIAAVTRAWLDGESPIVDRVDLPDWPLPSTLASDRTAQPTTGDITAARIRITDRAGEAVTGEVLLRPPSLVLGVGSSSGADPDALAALVHGSLQAAGLGRDAVGLVASIDVKRAEPAIVALAERFGVEFRSFPAESLAGVEVPNPSATVEAAVGTASVAEAAALLAAGPGARLVVPKQRSSEATVAVARRTRPEGHLAVVGLGPGEAAWRTPAAAAAVRAAEVVVGYGPYVDLAADLLAPHHGVVRSPIGAEADRCTEALDRAARGQRVALVCSGDPGVFAMASLVCELAPGHGDPPVTVVPGVTAALGAAARLGAPLGHDHATISLSDLLTPWPIIERRVSAVAAADLAVSFYNPKSTRRSWQLSRAVEILAAHRPPGCPLAVVTDVGRPGERIVRSSLDRFADVADQVGMLSLVVVGSSTTRWVGPRMVTPRGYATTNAISPSPHQPAGVQ